MPQVITNQKAGCLKTNQTFNSNKGKYYERCYMQFTGLVNDSKLEELRSVTVKIH